MSDLENRKPSEFHVIKEVEFNRQVIAVEDFYPPLDPHFTIRPISFGVVVVLVANKLEEYAAYIGLGTRDESLEWIADHGTKLTFKQAQKYFEWLNPKFYRR